MSVFFLSSNSSTYGLELVPSPDLILIFGFKYTVGKIALLLATVVVYGLL